MRLSRTAFVVITGTFTLVGCGGNEKPVPESASTDPQSAVSNASTTSVAEPNTNTSPALPFPYTYDLLTKEQARDWATGSWTLDYGAKLEHARSDEDRTAFENEQRDRIASLEFRDDGTFTMSNELTSDSTETTRVGTWIVEFPFRVKGTTNDDEFVWFDLQPNGFLLQNIKTEKGRMEDWWKKIR